MSNYKKDDVHRLAEAFKALSNPNRLHIFLRLVSCCPPGTKCITDEAGQCVGDVGRDLEIDPSTVSHHLKELRRSGLIRMERRGKRIICWVDREMVQGLTDLLTGCPLLTLPEEMNGLMQGNAPKSHISKENA